MTTKRSPKSYNRVQKRFKRICQSILIIFLGLTLALNILAFAGAYGLTHHISKDSWGLGKSRPVNSIPDDFQLKYIIQRIPIDRDREWLETWLIPIEDKSQGLVLMFPGNGGSKTSLLAPARVFHNLGYDTLLMDFRGVGGSSGNTTTVGMREAEDVVTVMNYIQRQKSDKPIILYGVSMGSAAILRAIAQESNQKFDRDIKIDPDAIILELPFARFLDAVRSRFKAIGVLSFPISELIVFWGSIQHGFNGFTHNPSIYASQVKCPTLILHGRLDKWTTVAEINEIFNNLNTNLKQQVIFPNAGHNLLVTVDKDLWSQNINQFLKRIKNETYNSSKL